MQNSGLPVFVPFNFVFLFTLRNTGRKNTTGFKVNNYAVTSVIKFSLCKVTNNYIFSLQIPVLAQC